MDEVEAAFGIADKKTDTSLIYLNKNTDNNCLGFLFNQSGELYTVTFILE